MNRRAKRLCVTLLLAVWISTACAEDYQQLAKTDLDSIRDELLINAAQVLDKNDVSFHAWIIRGYELAVNQLVQVHSAAAYYYLMRYYVNGFRDPHLQFNAPGLDLSSQWPEFSLRYNNGNFVVAGSQSPQVKDGIELINCDGQTPKQLMLQRVFPYFGNPAMAASWVINTPRLLIDHANPWAPKLKECEFQDQGKTLIVSLAWQAISDADVVGLLNAGKAQTSLGVEPFAKTGIWVYLPSFATDTATEQTSLNNLIKDLLKQRTASPIVLDLRGNYSKGFVYVQQLVQVLYGSAPSKGGSMGNEQRVWRVSPDNFEYLDQQALPQLAEAEGKDSGAYQNLYKNMLNMKQALAQHVLYYTELAPLKPRTENQAAPPAGKVLVLVDNYCVSACLDLLDAIKVYTDVVLVGQHTNADTIYRQTRNAVLPSGNHLMLPMTIIKNSVRQNNQYYQPCYTYSGNIVDTQAVQDWLTSEWRSMQACTIKPR